MTDWKHFIHCINKHFGPPNHHNQIGALAPPQRTATINYYTDRFQVHMIRTGPFDERQQITIYTNGLLEPLKMEVERQNPQEMEKAISWALAYE
jgi:hypothetical protein